MAKKKKEDPGGPSNAYLMSFGDTMTTLLAFFIVLNSLAEEQTGANLHSGTGSFIRSVKGTGLAGSFPGTRTGRAVSMTAGNPLYITEDPSPESGSTALGPDTDANNLRVIERESEQLERFLEQSDQRFGATELSETAAETVFDLFNSFPTEGPILQGPHRKAVLEVASRAVDPDFRIEFTVWATTPGETAIRRAADQALRIQREFIQLLRLGPEPQQRISATARVWFRSDVKRPVMSITVRKR
ncbi:MAG: hypothetical protein KDB14_00075 [Planctomycetales bacterium]|nr:hypothetical protein [Planctomycetales bacterium]